MLRLLTPASQPHGLRRQKASPVTISTSDSHMVSRRRGGWLRDILPRLGRDSWADAKIGRRKIPGSLHSPCSHTTQMCSLHVRSSSFSDSMPPSEGDPCSLPFQRSDKMVMEVPGKSKSAHHEHGRCMCMCIPCV